MVLEDVPGPPKAPRVRFARMLASSYRLTEVLRILQNSALGTTNLLAQPVVVELVRRGALEHLESIMSSAGSKNPTLTSQHQIKNAISALLDLQLITKIDKYKGVYTITIDGMETLADWDSTTSDGVYGREIHGRR